MKLKHIKLRIINVDSIVSQLDWPPVSSDHEVPQRAAPTARLPELCIERHSGVSILVTAVIAAIIGHRELLITQPSLECFHVSRMNGRIQSDNVCGELEVTSLQSVRVYLRD